ncbi:amino acid deaminase [Sciscionella sediminilitoris]|uniref:amino acid deaminase n=1 Tax=Sciscionella sediminilitoris TaxID=1445613 RepID=UPI00069058D1|nr:amino acid deaminase [Sciscionella sp. SE31]
MVKTDSVTITPGTIDPNALAEADEIPVDWRHKGMPPAASGTSIAAFAAERPNIFTDGFHSPLLVLDDAAMRHNVDVLARLADARGIALAPHGKTTMAPRLFERQLRAGAWGITAATFSQVRVYRAFGVSRVLLANQLVDPVAIAWIAAESARDPGFEFSCFLDSSAGIEIAENALAGTDFQLPVLIELGGAGGRTGVRDVAAAVELAQAVAASPALRLAGVGGYEAALAHGAESDALSTVDGYLRALRELVDRCAPLFPGQVLVTAGGSAYFDQVTEVLTEPWPAGLDVLPVLRSGAYLTHDSGFYEGLSPLGAHQRLAGYERLRPAMRLWARVSSKPDADLALLTLGRRDVSFDQGMPSAEVIRREGKTVALSGVTVTKLNDQHAYCALGPGADIRVGDWIGLGASHPCTVFDKWQLIPVLDTDGETVLEFVRTYF